MPSEYKIFISHRLEDRSLASIVSGALQLLSDGRLETFVCEDIRGGREWRDWIYKKIQLADIMLFLYTDESHDWMWCFYEIGLFLGPMVLNMPFDLIDPVCFNGLKCLLGHLSQ